ncbi:MAG: DUF975 family protein [Erysipelotrichales bacterium]
MNIKQLFIEAKNNLEGNWAKTILSNILIGFISSVGLTVLILLFLMSVISSIHEIIFDEYWFLITIIIIIFIIAFSIFMIILYTGFKYSILDLYDKKEYDIIGFLDILKMQPLKVLGLILLIFIYTFLWSLLLIVPGIIKGLSYSQALYILKDNPDKTISECINESKKIMDGNKLSLFWASLILVVISSIPTLLLYGSDYMSKFLDNSVGYSGAVLLLLLFYYLLLVVVLFVSLFITPLTYSVYAVFYRRLVPRVVDEKDLNKNVWDIPTTSTTIDSISQNL